MFGVGYRTPAKESRASTDTVPLIPEASGDSAEVRPSPLEALTEPNSLTKVRRSIDEWETGRTSQTSDSQSPPIKEAIKAPPKMKPRLVLSQGATARGTTLTAVPGPSGMPELERPKGRVAEAKACLIKAKLQINSSRNLKAEIKAEVTQAVETLYRLVKESEEEKSKTPSQNRNTTAKTKDQTCQRKETKSPEPDLIRKIEEHAQMIKANSELLTKLNRKLEEGGPVTYASIAATPTPQPVHSMVVSSKDTKDTSEDVIEKIRSAVNARTSGIRVDRLRKAREGKVVLGCKSRDELDKISEKLKQRQPALLFEQKENKDPLVILRNVLAINTDDDIIAALRTQNLHILQEIPERDYRAVVRYRRKARNPHECHVVLRVSPQVWRSLTTAGKVHIDLQRVQVSDQTPLLQCTKCLAYGHGKKSCKEAEDQCTHCTGPHLRKDCPQWKAGEVPVCRNCVLAKVDKTNHNCFDSECPIRKKWDRLARTSIAYC